MGESQRRIYDIIEKKYMSDIVSNKDSRFKQDLVKARLIRMMQAATNPALLSVPLKKFADYGGFDADVVGEDDILIVISFSTLE